MEFLNSALDTTLSRRPDELIGAVLMAAALTVAATGLHRLLRRWSTDPSALMSVVMFPGLCLAMALVAGYIANDGAPPPAREYPIQPQRGADRSGVTAGRIGVRGLVASNFDRGGRPHAPEPARPGGDAGSSDRAPGPGGRRPTDLAREIP